jgi:plasmid stabilization system protein ParE
VSFRVRFTSAARQDLRRLFIFLAEPDYRTAVRARKSIAKALDLLAEFPWTCRKADTDNPFLRELVIPFGSAGYVALFEIDNDEAVTILAVRHQREDDFL